MANIINGLLGIALKFVGLALVAALILGMIGNSQNNSYLDSKIPVTLSIVNDKFTPSYIGSTSYWTDREDWYGYLCLKDRKNCGDHTRFTHEQYINARYNGLYERIENDGKFRFSNWF